MCVPQVKADISLFVGALFWCYVPNTTEAAVIEANPHKRKRGKVKPEQEVPRRFQFWKRKLVEIMYEVHDVDIASIDAGLDQCPGFSFQTFSLFCFPCHFDKYD